MEQHPVPQNVTTFQFRLIGDMTIKQFGYLAGGAILAYISYILPLPFFFTWPLTVIFAFLGIGFAFIPIEERPMDIWVLSFLKSVYAPTQFVWHRIQPTASNAVSPAPASNAIQANAANANIPSTNATQANTMNAGAAKTQETMSTAAPAPSQPPAATALPVKQPIAAALQGFYTQTPAVQKKSFFDSLFSWVDKLFPTATPQQRPVSVPQTQTQQIQQAAPPPGTFTAPASPSLPPVAHPELEQLQTQISKLQTDLAGRTNVEDRVLELQKELSEMKKQKQEMEARIISMKKQTDKPQEHAAPTKPAGIITTPPSGPTVKIITPDAATRAGLPRLTTFANVVTGIIKDNQGGLLPGVLVTVRDKEGIPLRALKANKIGQFAASTQLPNGVFFVEVEDPRGRYLFDRAQITLNGSVMPAIEIVAKSKRDIDREVLVKQIFGQTTNT